MSSKGRMMTAMDLLETALRENAEQMEPSVMGEEVWRREASGWYQPSPFYQQRRKPGAPVVMAESLPPDAAGKERDPKRAEESALAQEQAVPAEQLPRESPQKEDFGRSPRTSIFWEEELRRTGHPGPKVCLRGRQDYPVRQPLYQEPRPGEQSAGEELAEKAVRPVEKQAIRQEDSGCSEEASVSPQEAAPPAGSDEEQTPAPKVRAVFQNRTVREPDSLSRLLSAQVCAALLLFLGMSLLRMVAEPAYLAVQSQLRDALCDVEPVIAVAAGIGQIREQGLEESLRVALSKGMEEREIQYVQGEPSELPAAELSLDPEPVGGTENPQREADEGVSWSGEIPLEAAAAGGRYPVSMEQEPFALAALASGFQRSAGAVMPVEGSLTCDYGPREHPITGKPDFHTGIDIGAPLGTPVYAAAAGVVEKCGTSNSLGNYLMVRHSSAAVTTYSHCSQLLVEEGEPVSRGQVIALVGSTGVSTGPHLHFECLVNGVITDPSWILEMPLPQG